MLTVKKTLRDAYQFLQGPIRVKHPKVTVVSGASENTKHDHSALLKGIKFSGVELSLNGDKYSVKLPGQSKIEISKALGWKTIFDGRMIDTGSKKTKVSVPLNKLLRITTPEGTFTVDRIEDKSKFNAIPTLKTKGRLSSFRGMTESVVIHALLIAAIFYAKDFNPFSFTPEMELIEINQETIPVVLEALESSENEYAGRNMSLITPEQRAERRQKKANKIAANLGAISKTLSKINLGNVKITDSKKSKAWMNSKASKSLKNSFGTHEKTALSAVLKSLFSGKSGKGAKWDLYGMPGKSISRTEQRNVSEVFRALHGEFRNCYESALLRFEDMAVTVRLISVVKSSGGLAAPSYTVTGNSTDDSKKELLQCLDRTFKRVNVGKSLKGFKIKNEFIFKS